VRLGIIRNPEAADGSRGFSYRSTRIIEAGCAASSAAKIVCVKRDMRQSQSGDLEKAATSFASSKAASTPQIMCFRSSIGRTRVVAGMSEGGGAASSAMSRRVGRCPEEQAGPCRRREMPESQSVRLSGGAADLGESKQSRQQPRLFRASWWPASAIMGLTARKTGARHDAAEGGPPSEAGPRSAAGAGRARADRTAAWRKGKSTQQHGKTGGVNASAAATSRASGQVPPAPCVSTNPDRRTRSADAEKTADPACSNRRRGTDALLGAGGARAPGIRRAGDRGNAVACVRPSVLAAVFRNRIRGRRGCEMVDRAQRVCVAPAPLVAQRAQRPWP